MSTPQQHPSEPQPPESVPAPGAAEPSSYATVGGQFQAGRIVLFLILAALIVVGTIVLEGRL